MKATEETIQKRRDFRTRVLPDDVLKNERLENESDEDYAQRRMDYKDGIRMFMGKNPSGLGIPASGTSQFFHERRTGIAHDFMIANGRNNRKNTKARKRYRTVR